MAVTLKELYDGAKEKEEIQLVAGEAGMCHIVRWVHMVEGTDISSFLEGDEVAFTTGIALHDETELLELVKYNYRQQAAGMVINVGPYIAEIPKEVIAFAESHAFPLFRVPWRVHMANIMRDFTTRINQDEQKKMELEIAFKNAVYLPENADLYLPTLLKHGYKKEWTYLVAVVEVLEAKEADMQQVVSPKMFHYAQEYFYAWQKASLVFENGGDLVIVGVNVTGEQMQEKVSDFCNSVKKYGICDGRLYGGVGRSAKRLREVGRSFTEAQQAKRLQRKRERKNQVLSYGDLGLYQLLFSLEGTDVLEDYYNGTIGILEKYDRANGTDYCLFLGNYFAWGCSVQNMAEKLHMHRNSVTYKLHKIEEIIGLSVTAPADRTRIMVGLMIQEIR